MDEARVVIERLDRIEALHLAGAPARELLAELEALVDEAEAWAQAEHDDGAIRAVDACRRQLGTIRR